MTSELARLARDLAGQVTLEQIDRAVAIEAATFAHPRVQHFVALLIERGARHQLADAIATDAGLPAA